VFFAPGDAEAYLELLRIHARRAGLAIIAYCLMPNHVHTVAIPSGKDSLGRALQSVHSQYAQRVNRMRGIVGHLWQGRYHSCALDANHFLNAVRYVERNPVAARLVQRAEDYPWSSAAAHCGLRADRLLEPINGSSILQAIADWSGWLAIEVPDECRKLLQRNLRLGLPCGSDDFVRELESRAGRDLRYHSWGGRRKKLQGV
jgi:putative transposase